MAGDNIYGSIIVYIENKGHCIGITFNGYHG
jgi:hypothetical protein